MYIDLNMERTGLFELLQNSYQPKEVLYPGCSIHITPAFFFPHMVFVDQDPSAIAFFADQAQLLEFVHHRRSYRRNPYIQFIAQDYTQPLPVSENQFDLLLALFAGGISKACKSYLKVGGLLLTNDHQGDAAEAANDEELTLTASIENHQGKYRFVEPLPVKFQDFKSPKRHSTQYLRQTSRGFEYIENERYYLFKRIRPR